MSGIGDTAKAAGTAVVVGALNVIETSGKLLTTGSKIVGNVADTGKNLTSTVSSVTGTIAGLSEQIQTKTQEAAIALATTEKDVTRKKIALSQVNTNIAIAKRQAQSTVELEKFKNKEERELNELRLKQQSKIAELKLAQEKEKKQTEEYLAQFNAESTQSLLKQEDNIKNQEMAYYYGFKDSNTNSEVGFKKSIMPFTNWCYSYIPEYFVTTNAEMIEFEYPDELLKSKQLRPSPIMAINKKTNQNIIIDFEYIGQKNFMGKLVYSKVPVIEYVEDPDKNPIYGKMYYRLLWFVCPSYIKGGKKRKTQKSRKTNKTHKKRKANRRRTAARRHNRR